MNALKLAMVEYARDNDDRLPPLGRWPRFHEAVMPYAKSEAVFHAYDDRSRLILPNPRLSGQRVSGVTRLSVILYESKPARVDGSRWVAFLPENAVPVMSGDPDFRGLRLVKEADWKRLKAANGIP